ncbi:hypothetical protein OHB01_36345 [Microbispora hainanensis]|uniref:hypothetical protein n=1 Tax=Microbispora hainanensis TaxID=568844 RepID=UPI002E299499|nr:hypothetical protein [Microbispora hainanensis]
MRAWSVRAIGAGRVCVLPGPKLDDREGLAGGRAVGRPQWGIGDQAIPPAVPPLTVGIVRMTKVLRIDIEQIHGTSIE